MTIRRNYNIKDINFFKIKYEKIMDMEDPNLNKIWNWFLEITNSDIKLD